MRTDQIVQAMRTVFPAVDSPGLGEYYQMMEYHLGWRDTDLRPANADPGKLIRPHLVVLACRTCGGQAQEALPLAAAIQLLHDFSLVHDDIQDHSEQRRGRVTVWRLWGIEHGINVGDGLFALAHRALYGLADRDVPPVTVLAVARQFEETVLRICEGQHLDLSGERSFDVTEDQYIRMIRGKTAALVAASTGLGARLATDDENEIEALYEFGEALGLAFQMQDDLLDIWGDPAQTGKPFASDLLQRKMSLPVVHAYTHAGAQRATIERIYRSDHVSEADVHELLAVLRATESRAYVASLAEREHQRATAALDRVRPVDMEAYAGLRALGESLLNRGR